jgi:hypothetical protein
VVSPQLILLKTKEKNMSLFNAMNSTATTQNGAKAFHTSTNANVDLFYLAGASRGKNIDAKFIAALVENQDEALRTLQWLRDVREGAGERQLFRDLFKVLVDNHTFNTEVISGASKIITKIPELGRFDDLLWIYENVSNAEIKVVAIQVFRDALVAGNGLAYKWTPIKGDTAKALRKLMGFHNEKEWRKHVVANRSTVEQQMCAKEWDGIEFGKLPSVASARYQKAFGRNAPEKYGEYIQSLVKGEVKVNAGAVYPYDIVKSVRYGNATVADAQWKALPNYIGESTERFLPMVDVSGSMSTPAGRNATISCLDVAISLGLYLSERNNSVFKDTFLTFSANPKLEKLQGTLSQRLNQLSRAQWDMNTDIQKAFKVVLNAALENNVPQEEMPTTVVILSDMQFDRCVSGYKSVTASKAISDMYESAGYVVPKVVFWNLNAANTTTPVESHQSGAVLVSGFSPSLMKSILGSDNPNITPYQVMLAVIMSERYNLN